MHGHVDDHDGRVGEGSGGDPFRDRLDEVRGVTREHGGDLGREDAVVDGPGQIVGSGRAPRVEVHDDVGAEGLALAALVVEDAVEPGRRDPSQPDLVVRPARLVERWSGAPGLRGHVLMSVIIRPSSLVSVVVPAVAAPQAAATRTASAEPLTSCTRTHHAPAAATSAVTAAVA